MTVEKHDGPTPNGGVRSEAYYHDGNFNPVEKSKAKAVEIVEIDEAGNVIHRTHAEINNDQKE